MRSELDETFRFCVEGDLKYSPTFWFWWHAFELRSRLREALAHS